MICSDCAVLIHPCSSRPQERWRDIAQRWQMAKQISKIIISRFQQPPCLFPAPYPHPSPLALPFVCVYWHSLDLYKYRYSIWTDVLVYFERSLHSMGKLVHRKWIEKKHFAVSVLKTGPLIFTLKDCVHKNGQLIYCSLPPLVCADNAPPSGLRSDANNV